MRVCAPLVLLCIGACFVNDGPLLDGEDGGAEAEPTDAVMTPDIQDAGPPMPSLPPAAADEGDACGMDDDCTYRCWAGTCTAGLLTDACTSGDDCAGALRCGLRGCHWGVERDPCNEDADCAPPHRCGVNECIDGSEGDRCRSDLDCLGACLNDVCSPTPGA